jgi:Carboxypeptidase regulatory-like domain
MKTLSRLLKLTNAGAFMLVLNLVVVSSVSSQGTAKFKGTVFCETGAVVPGVRIRIESNGIMRAILQSDESGRFEFDLPLGSYEVSIEHFGLGSEKASIEDFGFKKYFIRGYQLKHGVNPELVIRLEFAPQLPHPPIAVPEAVPEVTIEAIHAPVFQKIGPMKLK